MVMENRIYEPIELPKLNMPRNFRYFPSVQHEYVDVDGWCIRVNRFNLERYLEQPSEFLRVMKDALRVQQQLRDGTSAWSKMDRDGELQHHYHVIWGIRTPMTMAPWKRESEDTDDYLTVYALEYDKTQSDGKGIRHYISLEKHEELMKDRTRQFKKEPVTLNEIQARKDALAKEMAKLDSLEFELREKALRRQQRNTTAGHVYLLRAVHDETLFKIGRTNNPKNRLQTFSVKLPFPVEYDCLIETENMHKLESELHRKFHKQRLDGEWFRLSPDDVEYIKGLATP